MQDPLLIIALVACLGVLVILLLGINAFRKGTAESAKESNKYMRWRLMAQFGAVVLIMLFVWVRGQTGN
ncbi:twin transmembrane helix small protein [Roseicyclus persicicus]|uniref:Twin transmembrane helix small protein n=1 Tax=Roseicyclus persicicus TaxID=2650661 RepID=A0A7X6GVQ9_9RHOB|nr:twin transmembrane helix small protein [Roseibacterium persicicum]